MKSAVVTGGANGIGRDIVKKLLNSNYNVLIVDFDEYNLKKTINEFRPKFQGKVSFKQADLSKISEINNVIEFIRKNFNELSLLVNNAGIFPSKSMFNITERDWDQVHELNLKSLFFITQGLVKIMIENKTANSNIINVTSTASEIARPGIAHYASSKAGLKMLTQVLALELANYNIRVNSVGPGLVETESLLSTLDNEVAINEHNEKIGYYPLNRPAKVDEISEIVLFLGSEKASFINGQNILIDGGYSAGKVFKSVDNQS